MKNIAVPSPSPSLAAAQNLSVHDAPQRSGVAEAFYAFAGKLLVRGLQKVDGQLAAGNASDFLPDRVSFAMSDGGLALLLPALKDLRARPGLHAASVLEAGVSGYVRRDRNRKQREVDLQLRRAWQEECATFLAAGRLTHDEHRSVTRIVGTEV